MMLRALYGLLALLALPFIAAVDGLHALRDPSQRGRLRERLGRPAAALPTGALWVHAVSVGEVQAAAALVRELRRRAPDHPVFVTTVTATGAARARALFGDDVAHAYLPYDISGPVRRFLDHARPVVAVMMETEVWPVLYRELARREVPLVIASARLSERSMRRYRRVASLIRDALAANVTVCAQTEADAARFRELGAMPARVQVTGNVKFDQSVPDAVIRQGRAWRARHAAGRPVWVAGSTHPGEEVAAFDAHVLVRSRHPDALLVIAPRHPQRFEAVRLLLAERAANSAVRSRGGEPGPDDPVYLADTLGELQAFYAAADVAFVGGSLVPVGGHSLLEPASLGVPVVSGPHVHNAPDVAAMLESTGALEIVRDDAGLGAAVLRAFDDPENARARGGRGREAMAANRGAVDRVAAVVLPLLSRTAARSPSAAAAPPASSGTH
ncbi:MAG: lipid IV(A) 3-deoxy-D-manno-octulosonic acid transferase [Steroidobacteraceae bacterium]